MEDKEVLGYNPQGYHIHLPVLQKIHGPKT